MSFGDVATRPGAAGPGEEVVADRLSLGVAARLSRYLQVLTQARKMGKETISSQELSEYTHVNSTQIRRDLSGFGKFGKRGVGYNVDSLVSQIRKILRTSGQHNIALFGAGNLGRAIASSDIFADHGFRVVALFDNDTKKIGQKVGHLEVRPTASLPEVVKEEDIVVGVLAVPASSAQEVADALVGAFERLQEAASRDEVLAASVAGELISSEIEIRSGRGETFDDAVVRQQECRNRLFELAGREGVSLGATGTHFWSPWQDQHV